MSSVKQQRGFWWDPPTSNGKDRLDGMGAWGWQPSSKHWNSLKRAVLWGILVFQGHGWLPLHWTRCMSSGNVWGRNSESLSWPSGSPMALALPTSFYLSLISHLPCLLPLYLFALFRTCFSRISALWLPFILWWPLPSWLMVPVQALWLHPVLWFSAVISSWLIPQETKC